MAPSVGHLNVLTDFPEKSRRVALAKKRIANRDCDRKAVTPVQNRTTKCHGLLGPDNRSTRFRVVQIVNQLSACEHGIERHNDCTQTPDREHADYRCRSVLIQDDNTVAFLYPVGPHCNQGVDLLAELPEAKRGIEIPERDRIGAPRHVGLKSVKRQCWLDSDVRADTRGVEPDPPAIVGGLFIPPYSTHRSDLTHAPPIS